MDGRAIIDFLMGPFGAAALISGLIAAALTLVIAALNVVYGLSEPVRRYGFAMCAALGFIWPAWMALFFGVATVLSTEMPVAIRVVIAAFATGSAWLAGTAVLAMNRILRLRSLNDL